MSSWGEIKHAINSTLGTSNFKPLDKLLLDNRELAASDSVYKNVFSGEIIREGIVGTFTTKVSGSVRVFATVGTTLSTTYNSTVTVDGVSMTFAGGQGDVIKAINMNVTAGKTYTISFRTSGSGNHTIKNVYVGATIIDGSLMEVKSEG